MLHDRDDRGRGGYEYWAALAVLAVAALLRLALLTHHGLRNNEFITAWAIDQPWFQMIRERLGRNHTPLYFMMMKSWIGAVGLSEWSLRLPSAIAGWLAVWAVWAFGRSVWGAKVGLAAVALAAIHQFWLHNSFDARMYSIIIAVAVAAAGAGFWFVETGRWPWALAYIAVIVFGVGCQLLALSIPVSLVLWWFFHCRRQHTGSKEQPTDPRHGGRRGNEPAISPAPQLRRRAAIPTVLLSPIILTIPLLFWWSQVQYKIGSDRWRMPRWGGVVRQIESVVWGDRHFFEGWLERGVLIFGLLLLAAVIAAWVWSVRNVRSNRGPGWSGASTPRVARARALIAWWGVIPPLAILILSINSHSVVGSLRYYAVAGAAVPLIVAVAWLDLPCPRLRTIGLAISFFFVALHSAAYLASEGDGIREAVRFIRTYAQPDDLVVLCGSTNVVHAFPFYHLDQIPVVQLDRDLTDHDAIYQRVAQAAKGHKRIWLFLYHSKRSPAFTVMSREMPELKARARWRFNKVRVALFEVQQ